jgi:hypothetical protein
VCALLAGVFAYYSVRKGGYLLKRPYGGATKGAPTGLAVVGRAREWPPRAQRAVFARRAD